MPTYNCENCNYISKLKADFNKHLNTKKHLNNIDKLDDKLIKILNKTHSDSQKKTSDSQMTHIDSQMTHSDSQMTHSNSQKSHYDSQKKKVLKKKKKVFQKKKSFSKKKIYECKYCQKTFTRYNNLNRHIKQFCSIYKNENNTIEKLETIIIENENKYKKEIDKLHKKIELLLEQKQVPTTIINIDKQINLNSYGNEDMSHITSGFKDNLLKVPFIAIPKMIEEVHFSNKKPENKNIVLPNKNDKYVKVYQGDKWVFKDKNQCLKRLMFCDVANMLISF